MPIVPVYPQTQIFRFLTRRCSGNASDSYPNIFTVTQTPSQLNGGVSIGTQTIDCNTLALFSTATSTTVPTNLTTLQTYAQEFSLDSLNWLQNQFDQVFTGIAAVAPNGLIDTIEWDYTSTICKTRISSGSPNQNLMRLGAQDPAAATNCPDTDDANTAEPCIKWIAPITSDASQLGEFLVCFEDGRLVEKYIGPACGDKCGCCSGNCGFPPSSLSVSGNITFPDFSTFSYSGSLSYQKTSGGCTWNSLCEKGPISQPSGLPWNFFLRLVLSSSGCLTLYLVIDNPTSGSNPCNTLYPYVGAASVQTWNLPSACADNQWQVGGLKINTCVPLNVTTSPNSSPSSFTITAANPNGIGCCPQCCQTTCQPCTLPTKNLQLVATNLLTGNETLTLYYNGTSWTTGCDPNGSNLEWTLSCNGGQIEFRAIYWLSGSCIGGGTSQYCSNLRPAPFGLTLSSSTCSPLSLTYTLNSQTCPTVVSSGYTQFVVSDPSPAPNPPGLMCQLFTVYGCLVYPGVNVTVYQSQGGAQVATGITNSLGQAYLSWQGTSGSYYVVLSGFSSRWKPYAQTLTLVCGAGTTISLVAMSGYYCLTGLCVDPVAATLTLTGYTGGGEFPSPRSLVWGAYQGDAGWYDIVGQVYMSVGGILGYPSGGGITFFASPTTVDCPPAFELIYPGGTVTE